MFNLSNKQPKAILNGYRPMRAFEADGEFGIELFDFNGERIEIAPVMVRDMEEFSGEIQCNNLSVFQVLVADGKKDPKPIDPCIQTTDTMMTLSGIEKIQRAEISVKKPQFSAGLDVRIADGFAELQELVPNSERSVSLGVGDLRLRLIDQVGSLSTKLSKPAFKKLQSAGINGEANSVKVELELHKYKAHRMNESAYLHFWRSAFYEIFTINSHTLEAGHIKNSEIFPEKLSFDAFMSDNSGFYLGVDVASMIWSS